MPPVRLEDEEERHDERGKDAVEVHLLRLELGAEDRQRGKAARGLPRLAPHAQAPGRHARRREDLQEESLPLLGDFADVAQGREAQGVIYVDGMHLGRGAVVLIASDDRNALGWHLARTESSRAWSALVLHIAAPEVTVSDGGRRPREGAEGGVARHAPPALRLSRPLVGEALGCAPVRDLRRRGLPPQARPREARQGEALARQARGRRHALHLPRPGAGPRRGAARHQQQHRGRRQRPAEGHAQGPQEALDRAQAQGRLLVVLHALARLAARGGDPSGHAHRLRVMPTDRSIAEIYGRLDERGRLEGTIPRWGDAVVWSELHHSEPYRMDWD